jgi:arsenical pump membrane protein
LCAVSGMGRSSPWPLLRAVSWGVIPLVAGLFVLVEALDRSGVIHAISDHLRAQVQHSASLAAAESGIVVGIVSNLINNLPAGLIAGTAVHAVALPPSISAAILIGVDLGPNLSVTGSLATILWLTSLRRDGIDVKPWDFFKLGLLIMPPALLLSLWALLIRG